MRNVIASNIRRTTSLARANHSAESMKNGSYEVEVKGKNVIKILSVEFERVNGVDSLYRMHGRVAIERGHRPECLFFA